MLFLLQNYQSKSIYFIGVLCYILTYVARAKHYQAINSHVHR